MKNKVMQNFGGQIRCIIGDVQVVNCSLSKQPTFREATRWFPCEMTPEKRAQKYYTDDAKYPILCRTLMFENLLHAIRGTIQIWVVTGHQ